MHALLFGRVQGIQDRFPHRREPMGAWHTDVAVRPFFRFELVS